MSKSTSPVLTQTGEEKFFKVQTRTLAEYFERLWTALYCFRRQSYACTKPCAIRLFWHENPQNQPDTKVL